jgi:hypothetical protein
MQFQATYDRVDDLWTIEGRFENGEQGSTFWITGPEAEKALTLEKIGALGPILEAIQTARREGAKSHAAVHS